MKPIPWRSCWIVLIVLAFAGGCARTDPIDRSVSAETTVDYAMWKSRALESLAPQQARDFDTAVQEVKYKIMADGTATGSVAIDTAMREKIHGLRISEVIQLGFRSKIQRLEEERGALAEALEHNLRLRTRPDDTESADHLNAVREADARRLEAVRRDIEAADETLRQVSGASPYLRANPTPFRRLPDPTAPPRRPSHEA